MKQRILILLMTLLILSGGIVQAESPYDKLVEPGRTWWYWSWTSYSQGQERVILGLTLDRPDSDGWTPCYALDSLNQKVVDVPLCHLKEENGRVDVRPNLHLPVIDYKDRTNEQSILSTFLGYWAGGYYNFTIWNGSKPLSWNPTGEREFILYDFNYIVGDCYEWPWSGVSTDFSPNWERSEEVEGYPKIMTIREETIPTGLAEERTVKTYILKQYVESWSSREWSYTGNIKILEGIGLTSSGYENRVASYVVDMITWCGFFIAPMSICMADLSGSFYLPTIPFLKSVLDEDGTCLYYDSKYDEQTGDVESILTQDFSKKNISSYDLDGRPILNPLPGSVYVKGGKKYVER